MSDETGAGPEARLVGVGFSYRGSRPGGTVLDAVDLVFHPGRIGSVHGSNGSGKSTLLRLLAGFLTPTRGRCTLDGRPAGAFRMEHGIGFVSDDVGLPGAWTAWEVLTRVADLAVRGERATAVRDRAAAWSGLDDATLRMPLARCSRGVRQRVRLSAAFVGDPRMLVLDEPFVHLDVAARAALRNALGDARRREATVVVASHLPRELATISDVTFEIVDGGRVVEGPRDEPRYPRGGRDQGRATSPPGGH